jgi:hypothetical protein
MEYHVWGVRFVSIAILVVAFGLCILNMVSRPSAVEGWYVGFILLGCLGVLISVALSSIQKRLIEIEKKLEEK